MVDSTQQQLLDDYPNVHSTIPQPQVFNAGAKKDYAGDIGSPCPCKAVVHSDYQFGRLVTRDVFTSPSALVIVDCRNVHANVTHLSPSGLFLTCISYQYFPDKGEGNPADEDTMPYSGAGVIAAACEAGKDLRDKLNTLVEYDDASKDCFEDEKSFHLDKCQFPLTGSPLSRTSVSLRVSATNIDNRISQYDLPPNKQYSPGSANVVDVGTGVTKLLPVCVDGGSDCPYTNNQLSSSAFEWSYSPAHYLTSIETPVFFKHTTTSSSAANSVTGTTTDTSNQPLPGQNTVLNRDAPDTILSTGASQSKLINYHQLLKTSLNTEAVGQHRV